MHIAPERPILNLGCSLHNFGETAELKQHSDAGPGCRRDVHRTRAGDEGAVLIAGSRVSGLRYQAVNTWENVRGEGSKKNEPRDQEAEGRQEEDCCADLFGIERACQA